MALINTTTTGVLGTTVYGDGAGDLTVQKDGVTVNKITAAPAFSAYLGSNQTVSNATNTKLQINTENFDTASCYDSSTNYRFTPTVAGYYFLNAGATFGQGSNSVQSYIYKNGGVVFVSGHQNQASGSGNVTETVSGLVYANGTTDYFEYYVYQSSGGSLTVYASGPYSTYFTGFLARAA